MADANKTSDNYLNQSRIELVEKLVGIVADKLVQSQGIDIETALITARQYYRPQIQYLVDLELQSVDVVNQILNDATKVEQFGSIAAKFAENVPKSDIKDLPSPVYSNQNKDFSKNPKPIDLQAIADKVETDPKYQSNQDLGTAVTGEDFDNRLNANSENPAEPKTANEEEFLRRFQPSEPKSVTTKRDLDDLKNAVDGTNFDNQLTSTAENAQKSQTAAIQYAEKLRENQQAVEDEKLQAEKFKRQKPSRAESGPGGFYQKGDQNTGVSDQDLRDLGYIPKSDGTFDPGLRQDERDRRERNELRDLDGAAASGENYAETPSSTKKGKGGINLQPVKQGLGDVKSFGLYGRDGKPIKIGGVEVLPGVGGTSNRDFAATAMKGTKGTMRGAGEIVKSAGENVQGAGIGLQKLGKDLSKTQGDDLKAKAARKVGAGLKDAGKGVSRAGKGLKDAGDQIKKKMAIAAAQAVGAAMPMISTILIFVLGFGVMTAIIIIILCKALDTPGLGFVVSWIIPEELKGICKGLGFKGSCDTGSGGSSVSGSTPGIGAENVSCLSIIDPTISPELRAFMRTLTNAEGTPDAAGYYRLVGGKQYPNASVHPGAEDTQLYQKTGRTSDAFGKYQMLSDTWAEWAAAAAIPTVRAGTNSNGEKYFDISPKYQDLAVVKFLQSAGLENILKSSGIEAAINTDAACRWASVPGNKSGCSQKNGQSGEFTSLYAKLLVDEKKPGGCGTKQVNKLIDKSVAIIGPETQQSHLDRIFSGVQVNAKSTDKYRWLAPGGSFDAESLRANGKFTRGDGGSGGVDITIAAPGKSYEESRNTPVIAQQQGVVTHIERSNSGYGNQVGVYYPSLGVTAIYSHMETLDTSLNQEVSPGSLLGRQGSSGSTRGGDDGTGKGFVHIDLRLYNGKVSGDPGGVLNWQDPRYSSFVNGMLDYYNANEAKILASNFSPTAGGGSGGSSSPECNDPCLTPGATQASGSGKATSGLVKDSEGVEQKALFPDDSAVPNIATKLLVIGTSAKESGTDGNQGKLFLADLNRSQIGWFQQADSELNVFQAAGTDPKNGFMGNDQAQLKTFLKRIELEGQTANLDKISKEIVANGNKVTPNHISQIVSIYEKVQRSGEPGGVLGKVGQYITYALKNNLAGSYTYSFTLDINNLATLNGVGLGNRFNSIFGSAIAQAAGATKKYVTINKNGQEYGAYIITPEGFDPKTSTTQPIILGHDGFAGTFFADNKTLAENMASKSGGQVLLMDYERGSGSNPQIFSRDIDQTRAFMDYVDKETGKTNNFTLSGSSRGAGVSALTAAQDGRVNKLTIAYPVTDLSKWSGRGDNVYNGARSRYGNDLNGADLKNNPPKNPNAEIYLTVGDADKVLKDGDPNYLKNADEYVSAMKAKGVNITFDKIAGADHGYARLININPAEKAAQEKFLANATGKLGSSASGASCPAGTFGVGSASLLQEAKKRATGKRALGRCYELVASYIQTAGFGGIKPGEFGSLSMVGDQTYAKGFAEHFNTPGKAAEKGIKNLLDTNPNMSPYNAPAGAIVVVSAGSPGTADPTAGDITVADGKGAFYNDGEMGYGGPSAWNGSKGGAGKVLGIYVPI